MADAGRDLFDLPFTWSLVVMIDDSLKAWDIYRDADRLTSELREMGRKCRGDKK